MMTLVLKADQVGARELRLVLSVPPPPQKGAKDRQACKNSPFQSEHNRNYMNIIEISKSVTACGNSMDLWDFGL